jgi:hypothetical protein
MSQIRVKQIESGELFSFVENVFSGELGTLGDNVDFLLNYASGISGYADDLSDKIDLLSGQVIDLTDSFTGIDARLDIVSGMMTDLSVYTNDLSGYIDLVSGIAFSFSGLAQDAYDLSQTTADGLFNTGIIINLISGKVDSISGSLNTISGKLNTLSGIFTGFTGGLGLTGQQILGRETAALGQASGINVGRGLEISEGYLQFDSNTIVSQRIFTNTTTGSSATVIPGDNTIPQSGEGVQIFSQSYTPILTTSTITIEFETYLSCSAAVTAALAVFVDAGASAIASIPATIPGASFLIPTRIIASYPNTNTTAKTFKVNMGPTSAATIFFNRFVTAAAFGGVSFNTCRITELSP